MNYLSICSGIEAATVAWHPLGWRPLGFSEIEPFPSAVLAHHWPDVPNLGDMTQYANWPSLRPQLIVGGTPCQAFSVAGLRKGLADPRGNLTLTFLGILARYRPTWVVWENVPGVLSDRTGAFGAFLSGLAELGYGWAYRVLDAQHFGVPQRRRRVFVVGHLGDWRRAAAVLFERESLLRNSPPSREEGKGFTHSLAPCLTSGGRGTERTGDTRGQDPVVAVIRAYGGNNTSGSIDAATAVNAKGGTGRSDFESETFLVQQSVNHPFAIQAGAIKENPAIGPDGLGIRQDGCAFTLEARSEVQAVAFNLRGREGGAMPEVDPDNLVCQRAASGGSSRSYLAFQSSQSGVRTGDIHATLDSNNGSRRHNGVVQGFAVRRLTPTECERLQGFPDGHTLIPWRGKPSTDCPDGPRYKALGNSMAVPVMNWIGRRIELISKLSHD